MPKLRLLHQWFGLLLCIGVFAIASSGGILLFGEDIYRMSYPSFNNEADIPISGYAEIFKNLELDRLSLVKFPQTEMNTFQLWFKDDSEAFVDPGTGEVIAHWQWYESLPSILFKLHTELLIGELGEWVNAAIAFGILFLGASGGLLWWQRRRRFSLGFIFPNRFSVGNIMRNHVALGVVGLVPIMLFVVTGVVMIFYSSVASIMTRLLDEGPASRPNVIVMPRQGSVRSWEEILAKVDTTFPDGQMVYYYPPKERNAAMVFRKRLPGEWHPNGRSYVVIDPYQVKVVQAIDAREEGLGARIMNSVYPLHAAKVGGAIYKGVALAVAIVLVLLAGTGLISYGRYLYRPDAKLDAAQANISIN